MCHLTNSINDHHNGVKPLDFGRWVMKSIKTYFQHLVGMGNGLNNPTSLRNSEFYFAGKSHMTLHIASRRPASLTNNKFSPTPPGLVLRHDAPPSDHRGTPSKVPTLNLPLGTSMRFCLNQTTPHSSQNCSNFLPNLNVSRVFFYSSSS